MMFTEIYHPEYLPHRKLDEYLNRGWFRMGQMIFTCRFLCFEGKLFTAVWTRLALKDYTFRKSVRKIFNRNNKRFQIVIRRAQFDSEKENLYKIHRQRFEGYISTNLRKSLFGDADYNIYDTWETCVYDGDKLVAASFFDLGNNSIASIMGLFDPEYNKYSLGFYTMLLEIDFGLRNQAEFYYPGYVVPGYGKFDYKLRIGDTDYFNPDTKEWKPYPNLDTTQLSHQVLNEKLIELQTYFLQKNIPAKILLYPLYERSLFGYEYKDFIHYPLFISCFHQEENYRLILVEYDLFKETYRLIRTGRIDNNYTGFIHNAMMRGHDPKKSFFDFLFLEKIIVESSDMEEIAESVLKSAKRLRMI